MRILVAPLCFVRVEIEFLSVPVWIEALHVRFYVSDHIRSKTFGTVIQKLVMVPASGNTVLLNTKTTLRTIHNVHNVKLLILKICTGIHIESYLAEDTAIIPFDNLPSDCRIEL